MQQWLIVVYALEIKAVAMKLLQSGSISVCFFFDTMKCYQTWTIFAFLFIKWETFIPYIVALYLLLRLHCGLDATCIHGGEEKFEKASDIIFTSMLVLNLQRVPSGWESFIIGGD